MEGVMAPGGPSPPFSEEWLPAGQTVIRERFEGDRQFLIFNDGSEAEVVWCGSMAEPHGVRGELLPALRTRVQLFDDSVEP